MAKRNGRTDFRDIKGMDPAANWLLGAGRRDYLPDPETTPIPFLLEMFDERAVEAFRRQLPLAEGNDGNGALVVGFGEEGARIAVGNQLLVFASLDWFVRLLDGSERSDAFREADKRVVLGTPALLPPDRLDLEKFPDFPSGQLILASDRVKPPEGGWPKDTVIMAVIDDGVAFAHERLREANTATRVHAFWNMNALLSFGQPNALPLIGIPGELGKADIDALLAAHAPGGNVDEDAVYGAAKLTDAADPRHKAVAWRVAHGAHVLDLAAGYDIDERVANRPVIAVQLPTPIVAQTTGQLLEPAVLLAIGFVLYSVGRLAGGPGGLPVVINLSFGKLAGAHDGLGQLEQAMDAIIGPNVQIVLPAGNAQLSRCHAEIRFPRGGGKGPVSFELIVQPNDRTHSYVEIWLPSAQMPGNRLRLTVTRPDGVEHAIEEDPGPPVEIATAAGEVMGQIELISTGGRRMMRLTLMPTDRPQPDPRPLAQAGAWLLTFEEGPDPMDGAAQVWVQRDDSLYGYPQRGRQSYFDHPDYRRFDDGGFAVADDVDPAGPVTRASLFNAIGTGGRVITAGGYRDRDCRIAPYSAGGPNAPAKPAPPERRKPDALTPSDGSKAHAGVLAAGSRSGGRVALSGTSVAAPQLARRVARDDGTLADRDAVVAEAVASPICVAPDPPDPDRRAGWGRLSRADPLAVERYEPG